MDSAELGRLFSEFQDSAFRLEALDTYAVGVEGERFRMFIEGQPQPESDRNRPWLTTVGDAVAAGKVMERVHVVHGPALTDYLRFEFGWGYPLNEQAGERIFILDVNQSRRADWPTEDFWLFDDRVAVRMVYDGQGRVQDRIAVTDELSVRRYRAEKRELLAEAIPLQEFMQTLTG